MRTPTRALVALSLVVICAVALFAATLTIYQAKQTPPVKLGTSGGNVYDKTSQYCCSGTLGALVSKGGTQYILSNNHVLARSDQATVGEAVSQPGMVDSNCSTTNSTIVANYSSASKLGTNVDAALAQVVPGNVSSTGEILTVGVPSATVGTPKAGMSVAKAGRTTGFTCASIAATNTSVTVQYETQCGGGTTWNVSYTNQVLINSRTFSAGGDSGSLIVDAATARPVALLFAGSSSTTIANPIGDVMTKLGGITFVGGADHKVACSTKKPRGAVAAASLTQAVKIKEKHAKRWMDDDDAVMAVGVSQDDANDADAVVLVIVERGRKMRQDIPAMIDGVKTKVIFSDKIRAYGWNEQVRQSCAAK